MAAEASVAKPTAVAPDRPVFRLAQEREFYKYHQARSSPTGGDSTRRESIHICSRPVSAALDSNDFATHSCAPRPDLPPPRRASRDTALTAFAQLGALRLNVRRCVISLFDAHSQHVVAEATRTLSLQDDSIYEEGDELAFGCGVFPREVGICEYVVNMAPRAQRERGDGTHDVDGGGDKDGIVGDGTAFVVPDLTKDDRFASCPFIEQPPFARFYAGVPILSPRGIAIGVYAAVDDVPRVNGLDASQVQFLKDMAATVMNHLALGRWKQRHRRGERMIAGLGSFLEYKGTIRGAVQEDEEVLEAQTFDGVDTVEGRLNEKQQEIQDRVDAIQGGTDVYRDTLTTAEPPATTGNPLSRSDITEEQKLAMNLHQKVSTSPYASKDNAVKENPIVSDTPKGGSKPQDNITRMQQTFSRASNVIRESIEVEGVVFFDASVQSYTDMVQTASSGNTSDSDTAASCSETQTASSDDDKPADNTKKTVYTDADVLCDVLGFSTTNQSSINNDPATQDKRLQIPETLLRTFLRRYPHGKIFNFNENGAMSSGDSSDDRSSRSFEDSIHHKSRTRRKRITTRAKLTKEDAARLIQVFPGARSIAFFPLWDSHRLRWLSGCFAWTNTPMRVFAADDELSYLYAFGNCVMAEIARHDVEMADRAKVNLVSSISHELRSPLHGIVGTLELLGESGLNALQTEMVGMIGSCSRTLLDIVEHLLDFTEINNAAATDVKRPALKRSGASSQSGSRLGDSRQNKLQRAIRGDMSRPTTNVPLDVVVEEVVEAVCAGHAYRISQNIQRTTGLANIGPSRFTGTTTPSSGPMIVLDIQSAPSWVFDTEPGAWRRIVMNLFGNAMKYTKSGVISVSLSSSPVSETTAVEKKKPRRRRPDMQRRMSSYRSGSTVPDSDPDSDQDVGGESDARHDNLKLHPQPRSTSHPNSRASSPSQLQSLAPSRSRSRSNPRRRPHLVTLTVSDTGRGIQRSYLRDSLFKPFSQEDPLAPGNGLGLSIVRQAVRLLSGEIKVDSTEGIGTTVSVSVRMGEGKGSENDDEHDEGVGSASSEGESEGSDDGHVIERVVKRVSGKTLGLIGFEKDEFSALRGSLERVCRDWFGLDVSAYGTTDQGSSCNFYLTTLEGKQMLDAARQHGLDSSPLRPVITICNTFDAVQAMVKTKNESNISHITEYISQPCGPRKLAHALDVVTAQQELQESDLDRDQENPPSSTSTPTFAPATSPSVSAVSTVELPLRPRLDSSRSQSYGSATQTDVTTPSPLPTALMPVFPETVEAEVGETQGEEQEGQHLTEPKSSIQEADPKNSPSEEPGPNEPVSTPQDQAPPQQSQSVLLVDDNPINLKLLEALVKKHHPDWTRVTATNGIEAVEAFSTALGTADGGFDVVLMDISMPQMDGLTATREIRRLEDTSTTTTTTTTTNQKPRAIVAALTGLAGTDIRQDALRSGVDVFLTKPVRGAEVKRILEGVREVMEEEEKEETGEDGKEVR